MPGTANLGVAEEVPWVGGTCLRRLDPFHGYFYYHLGNHAHGPYLTFRPLAIFCTTATVLLKILQDFPAESTAELKAMYEFYRFADGEYFPSHTHTRKKFSAPVHTRNILVIK